MKDSGVTRVGEVGESPTLGKFGRNFGRYGERRKKGREREKEEEREKEARKRENGEEKKGNCKRGGGKLKMSRGDYLIMTCQNN